MSNSANKASLKKKPVSHGAKHKKQIRGMVSIVCSFLLAMFLTVLLAAIAMQFGFFNKGMTLNKINESDYYTNVYEELIENLDTIVDSKGIPRSVLTSIFTEKRVYINGKQFIENSLNNEDTVVSVDKIDEELNTALLEYYKAKNITVTDEIKSDMDATISSINSEYTRMVRFQFVDYIRKYKTVCYSVMQWLIPLLLMLSILLMVVLWKLHRYPHRGIRYIGIALVSAGLINLILPLFAIFKKWYTGFDITPVYYAEFLSDYFKWSLYSFVYTGIISIVISIVLFIWMRILKNQIK